MPIRWLAANPVARAVLMALHYSHERWEAEKKPVLPDVLWAVPDWSEFEEVLDQSSRNRLACAVPDPGQPAQLR